jgi:hypothetical protein
MTPQEPQRRELLRGLLAAGCALYLPMVAGAAEPTSGKLSQAAARYLDKPKDDQICAKCTHFIPESGICKVVEGQVSPRGWCKLWGRKPT